MFLPYYSYHGWGMPGASSTCGKGHEEGGLAYEKVGLSLRSPPGNSWASTPKTRVCLPSALCSHLHLWLYRGLSPTTSLWKRVMLQLQLIKFLGVTRVFQPTNSFGSPLACLNRFFWPHVIVQSLPTVSKKKRWKGETQGVSFLAHISQGREVLNKLFRSNLHKTQVLVSLRKT